MNEETKRVAKHYCDYWCDCECYENGYCWASARPVENIYEPCPNDYTNDRETTFKIVTERV